jgi:hypothetical protein
MGLIVILMMDSIAIKIMDLIVIYLVETIVHMQVMDKLLHLANIA